MGGASDESQGGAAVSEPVARTIAVACLDAGLRARADALAREPESLLRGRSDRSDE